MFQALDLPADTGRDIHQNRLLKIAREGAQMTPRDLRKFETERRHATLAALAVESRATVTDEIIDLHDRILIKLFAHARNKHQQHFHSQGKAINDKGRLYSAIGHALLQARDNGDNAFDAIDTLRAMNAASARTVPANAPTAFIKPRWRPLVFDKRGIDRRELGWRPVS